MLASSGRRVRPAVIFTVGLSLFGIGGLTSPYRVAGAAAWRGTDLFPTAEAQACTFTLSRTKVLAGPEGQFFGILTVTASAPSCVWTTSNSAPWFTLFTGTTDGTGTGTRPLHFTMEGNTTGATRSAAVTIAGQALNVTQQSTPCVTSVTPSSIAFPFPGFGDPAAQQQSVAVDAPADCHWQQWPWPIYISPNPPFGGVGPGVIHNVRIIAMPPGVSNPIVAGVGSLPLTLRRLDPPCVFTVSPSTGTVSVNGGSGTVTVTGTGTDCTFTATTSNSSLSIAQSSSATPATISYTMGPNPGAFDRVTSIDVPNATATITQNGAPVRSDVTEVRFGATSSGGVLTTVSLAEEVAITIAEQPASAWTATSSQPWLVVTPVSGSGPAMLRVSVDAAAAAALAPTPFSNNYTGQVTITAAFAPATAVRRIEAGLSIKTPTASSAPVGVFETPINNSTGLSGAIPVTGWAVDDIDIARIQIFRDPVAGEGSAEIFIADATRVKGARPDVGRDRPQGRRAGWGYMLLSNVLPGNGNGPFTFSAYADDLDGHRVLLGRKNVTFDNANATKPFGTIDVPAQGETVSGTILNRGWVLTPPPKMVPLDGSTIKVYIDGALVSPVGGFNFPRPDVKGYFPGLLNSDGPEARLTIDTTTLADGVHTIAWGVIDDAGAPEGIGSRYFTVQNGAASTAVSAAVEARSVSEVQRLVPLGQVREIRSARGERVEISHDPWNLYGCGRYTGFLRSGGVAGPLPPGASLDAERGIFSWQPPAEFAGTFDFVFVYAPCSGREMRIPVRVVIEK